jgi:hypothetical protein
MIPNSAFHPSKRIYIAIMVIFFSYFLGGVGGGYREVLYTERGMREGG